MTDKHRELAERVVAGESQVEIAAAIGIAERTVRDWLQRPDISALIAAMEEERNSALIRKAGKAVVDGSKYMERANRRLAVSLGLIDADEDLSPEHKTFLALLPKDDEKEKRFALDKLASLRENTMALNKLVNDGQDRAIKAAVRVEQAEATSIAMATARHEAKQANIPINGDEAQ